MRVHASAGVDGAPPSTGARVLALTLLAVLVASLLAAVGVGRLPAAGTEAAAPELFAAARAARVLDRIAVWPHPVGSADHERVRIVVREELERLGLEVEQQTGTERDVVLTNLLVRVPGTASTGTVLCCAHYDSVRTGPGAGDDGVGVVVWLEALRALRARGWQPRNDVLLLLSDGEELGLLGAKLFAREHPAAKAVATVVNLEAIGNGGPAVLFELGAENGERVRAFADAVAAPTGTSFADAVYRRMPNDTDLSVFRRSGVGGFNLALTAGSPAYHAPHDTPANLDPRSVQHMGECALALVEHLGTLDLASGLDGGDRTFFDVLGRSLVHYPRVLDLVPALLGTLLFLATRARARVGWGELARAVVAHAGRALGFGLAVALSWWVLDRIAAMLTPAPEWVTGNTTSGALLFAGLALLAAAMQARAARSENAARELAPFVPWSAAALAATVLVPGAGFVCAWPLCLAALAAFVGARAERPGARALVLVPSLAGTLLLVLPILHLLAQLFQRRSGPMCFALAPLLSSGLALFRPHFRAVRAGARWSSLALFTAGLLCMLASIVVARLLGWRDGALWR